MWNHSRFHPSSGKNLINLYKSFTAKLRLMLSYTTFLSFDRTSSMTSIITWPYFSTFSVDFFPDLLQKLKYFRFKEGSTVREEKDRPNNTCTLWNISVQRVMQNWFYLPFRKSDISQTQKIAYLKNNTAFLMLLSNLRHDDTNKKPKTAGTSPWFAENIWCYWSWNIRLDDGNVRRSSDINLRESSLPKWKLLTQGPRTLWVFYVLRREKRCCSEGNKWKQR